MKGSGRRLRRARRRIGLSAAELARLSGLSRSEISRWEAGDREVPRTDRVRRALAKAFEKEASLLGGYMDGHLPITDLFPPPPPPPTPLAQALALDEDRWSQSTIGLARDLEAEGRNLSPAEWVRQLDGMEKDHAKLRTRWQRILDDDLVDDD